MGVKDVLQVKSALKGKQQEVQRLFDLAQALGFGVRSGEAVNQHGGSRASPLKLARCLKAAERLKPYVQERSSWESEP